VFDTQFLGQKREASIRAGEERGQKVTRRSDEEGVPETLHSRCLGLVGAANKGVKGAALGGSRDVSITRYPETILHHEAYEATLFDTLSIRR
jgi:hypothetical protein